MSWALEGVCGNEASGGKHSPTEKGRHSQLGSVSWDSLRKTRLQVLAMARWAMSRKEGLGQVGAGPDCQAQRERKKLDHHAPAVCQVLPCKKGGQSPPILQVGKPRSESGSFCPGVDQEFQKGISESAGLAGLGWTQAGMCPGRRHSPSGPCPALRLWLWAWQHAQPSPQQLQASLLSRASKKTLYIFRLALNKCSFHLSPPPSPAHTLQGPAQNSS